MTAETLPLLPPPSVPSVRTIASSLPMPTMSMSKILLLKGLKTDFLVLDKYPWFQVLVLSSLVLGSVILFTTRVALIETASFLSCLFACYVFYQRRVLQKLGSFRHLHNQMREKINEFMLENDKLTRSIDQLQVSVSGIQDVERGLKQVCKTDQVEAFVQCVTQTRILNEKIKDNINTRIMQDILTSILRTDRNNDLVIDDTELNRLMLRLTMMPGFDFHQDRFLTVLRGRTKISNTTTKGDVSYSIGEMMQVFRNLLDNSIPDHENVFVLKPKQLLPPK